MYLHHGICVDIALNIQLISHLKRISGNLQHNNSVNIFKAQRLFFLPLFSLLICHNIDHKLILSYWEVVTLAKISLWPLFTDFFPICSFT